MTNIAVVIPYYQREPGILKRALASVYDQSLPSRSKLEVIVVDDCSPSPPGRELEGPSPSNISVRVIARSNGGPAVARNTGLEASRSADYFAFLDSDDQWVEDHLDRAIKTLGAEADFYFSNQATSSIGDNISRFEEICLEYASRPFGDTRLPASIVARDPSNPIISPIGPEGSYSFQNGEALTALLRSFLPHMSTTVIRASTLGHVRFQADLRSAGEDYLYFLSLAGIAKEVRFSKHVGAIRGRGVSVYHGALAWEDPRSVNTILDNYRCLLIAKKNILLSPIQQNIINRRISFRRLELVARLASQFNKDKMINLRICQTVMRADPNVILLFPLFFAQLVIRRLRHQQFIDGQRADELP